MHIQLDIQNMMADALGDFGVRFADLERLSSQIHEVHDGLEDLKRLGQMPFRDLPHREESVLKILKAAGMWRDRFDNFLLLGIGGSSLGTRFLSEALESFCDKKLLICDTLDTGSWQMIAKTLDFRKTGLIVVSKSGMTIETCEAFLYFQEFFTKISASGSGKNIMIITGPSGGILRKTALQEKWETLEIPESIGGRFSALTACGLFPLACLGVNIAEIMEGARRMDERCGQKDPWFNPALMSAVLHYFFDRDKNHSIRVIMPYGRTQRGYAAWFAQLWAESLGKKYSLSGSEIRSGTTPVSAFGPEDQHSQLQLYLEGPRDKTVTFVVAEEEKESQKLLMIEKQATEKALREYGCPNQTILLRQVTPQSLGQLLFFAEMETVYAGAFYNINPFNQPAVERIKEHIKSYLEGEPFEKKDRRYLI